MRHRAEAAGRRWRLAGRERAGDQSVSYTTKDCRTTPQALLKHSLHTSRSLRLSRGLSRQSSICGLQSLAGSATNSPIIGSRLHLLSVIPFYSNSRRASKEAPWPRSVHSVSGLEQGGRPWPVDVGSASDEHARPDRRPSNEDAKAALQPPSGLDGGTAPPIAAPRTRSCARDSSWPRRVASPRCISVLLFVTTT